MSMELMWILDQFLGRLFGQVLRQHIETDHDFSVSNRFNSPCIINLSTHSTLNNLCTWYSITKWELQIKKHYANITNENIYCLCFLLSSGRGTKLTTHLHLVARSKNEWSCTFTPSVRLHGVVLSWRKSEGQLYLYL